MLISKEELNSLCNEAFMKEVNAIVKQLKEVATNGEYICYHYVEDHMLLDRLEKYMKENTDLDVKVEVSTLVCSW